MTAVPAERKTFANSLKQICDRLGRADVLGNPLDLWRVPFYLFAEDKVSTSDNQSWERSEFISGGKKNNQQLMSIQVSSLSCEAAVISNGRRQPIC